MITIESGSTGMTNKNITDQRNLQFYSLAITNPSVNLYEAALWLSKSMGIQEDVANKVFSASVVTPDEEFVQLLTTGQMPDPKPTENFDTHLSKHAEHIQLLAALLGPDQSRGIAEMIMQHIMITEQLQQQITGKTKVKSAAGGSQISPSVNETDNNIQRADNGTPINQMLS